MFLKKSEIATKQTYEMIFDRPIKWYHVQKDHNIEKNPLDAKWLSEDFYSTHEKSLPYKKSC